jgi:hypothetical protein
MLFPSPHIVSLLPRNLSFPLLPTSLFLNALLLPFYVIVTSSSPQVCSYPLLFSLAFKLL